MKKIYRYIKFKIENSHLGIILLILSAYVFASMISLINSSNELKYNYNIYDLFNDVFSHLSLKFTISIIFMVSLYNIFNKGDFYDLLNSKLDSKMDVFNSNIISGFIFSFIVVLSLVILCILCGLFMGFYNK